MNIDSAAVQTGMSVVGCDGAEVGKVTQTHAASFTIERRGQPELSLPFGAIEEVDSGRVVLSVMASQVDQLVGAGDAAATGAGATFRCPYYSAQFHQREQRNEHVRVAH